MTTTLVVSDLHLGARNSQGAALLSLLDTHFDRVILNGDTIDHLDFGRYRQWDWEVLHQLRNVALKRELILLRGNHEGAWNAPIPCFGPLDVLAQLLKTELHEEYVLRVGSRRYLVLHGDQFDRTMNMKRLGYAADYCYAWVQAWSRPFARWLKTRVKRWGGVIRCVRNGAVQRAQERNCDGVIAGHTHFHEDELVAGIHYLNSGCWVDEPCTYLRAQGDGIELCEWTEEARAAARAALGRSAARASVLAV